MQPREDHGSGFILAQLGKKTNQNICTYIKIQITAWIRIDILTIFGENFSKSKPLYHLPAV